MDSHVFVASGSYGCVIKPGYTCSKNHDNKHKKKETKFLENSISKLFPKKKEWLKEIQLQEIVQTEIDPDSNFTIRMIDNCELIPSKIRDTHKIDRCSLVSHRQQNNIYQIIYENGGVDLYTIIIKRSIPDITSKFKLVKALGSFVSIFEGLKSLAIKNYVHHDIKLDNILYDIDKNRFILIDFGFLVNIKKTYNTNAFLFKDPHNLTFKYFPPEYNIMYYAYNNKTFLNSNDIYNINLYEFFSNFMSLIKKAMSNHRLPERYKEALEKITDTIEDYVYNKSKEVLKLFKEASEDKIQPTEKAIDEYLRTVSNEYSTNQIDIRLKIDSYMLGLFLLSVIVNSFIYLDEKNDIHEVPVKLFDLLLKMIDINPFTRIDIFDATDEYKKIFKL